jgi:predicted nuclease of restriction endonuclease-like (RecB) superfamily
VTVLERQIHSFLFARLLKSRDKAGVLALADQGQTVRQPIDVIKQPYVLDFLNLPDQKQLHESDIESAIIENLQPFLLELGKGFAFVARQYRVTTESQHFFIDFIFYNSPAQVLRVDRPQNRPARASGCRAIGHVPADF